MQWAAATRLPPAEDVEPGATIASLLFAIPNGGRRNIREAARLKLEGVKAGVWDMFLPLARGGRNGLWIELKSSRGSVSRDQKIWGERMELAGYKAVVCRGFDQARDAIAAYVGLRAA